MRALGCVALLLALLLSSLQGQTHVPEPAVNLGDTSFLDGLAGPGWVVEEVSDAGHDGRIAGSDGSTIPGTGSVNSISGLNHVAWLSHKRIAGGWYGAEVISVVAYVDARTQGRQGGFGDLTVGPFILQWTEHRLLHRPVEQRLMIDFDFPVGYYSRNPGVNLGSNAYRFHPCYAITVYPAKRIETSWRIHYLWNFVNNAPPLNTKAQSTQAGQAIHFNATTAYNVHKQLWIGANGYFLSQITDGRVNGVSIPNSPEQVGAIGPGMVWAGRHWIFYANGYEEFGARNRATGQKLVLRVQKVF